MENIFSQILLSESQIQRQVKDLGEKITADYREFQSRQADPNFERVDGITLVCVLKGAFMFCADLARHIDAPLKLEFIKVSSYMNQTQSSGVCNLDLDITGNIRHQYVVIVEDIVDTGHTVDFLLNHLKQKSPQVVKVCSLLFKPSRNKKEVPIDYLGFTIDDHFVVGYGLDHAGRHRELPYIGVFSSS